MSEGIKISLITAVFTIFGGLGMFLVQNSFVDNNIKEKYIIDMQKKAIERVYINTLKTENIFINLSTINNLEELDLNTYKKTKENYLENRMYIDLYLSSLSSKHNNIIRIEDLVLTVNLSS